MELSIAQMILVGGRKQKKERERETERGRETGREREMSCHSVNPIINSMLADRLQAAAAASRERLLTVCPEEVVEQLKEREAVPALGGLDLQCRIHVGGVQCQEVLCMLHHEVRPPREGLARRRARRRRKRRRGRQAMSQSPQCSRIEARARAWVGGATGSGSTWNMEM